MSATPLVPLVDPARFEIRASLGLGSQTGVFRAFDRRLGIEVALKTISQASQRSLYHLKREFRAAACLDHPGLVRLYELFQHGGCCYFTMELVEGADLLAWPGRFDAGARLRIARQLAEALHALHGANQLHRDVKPANMLVTGAERLVLLDFGFAIPIRDGLAPGREPPAGTFAYMAPEVLRGEPPTPASDWYSVGVVLHELMLGRVPEATLETLTTRLGYRRPDRRALSAHPGPLAELVHDLLEERPGRRPTGGEVLRRLGASEHAGGSLAPDGGECVGRTPELETLAKALERSRKEACFLQIVGASGIGKTRLVSAFLERSARAGRPVLRARCRPQEDVPYNALDGIVDELGRRLAEHPERVVLDARDAWALLQLFPALAPVLREGAPPAKGASADPQEVTRSAVRGLAALLALLAGEGGAILWVDDLHWADADSLRLLRLVLAALRPLPVLALLSARASVLESSPGIPVETLELGSLGEPAATELARRVLGPRGGPLAWVVEQAEGSPFLIVQLADYAAARRRSEALPSADAAIVQRIAESSPPCRRIAELLAVAGRPMEIEAVLEGAGLGRSALPEIFQLHERRLIRGAPGAAGMEVEIYHDRIREALLQTLPEEVRRATHLLVARALAGRPVDARVLAEHYRAGGDAASAARLARSAARDALATLAFGRAADLFEMVLTLEPEAVDGHALRRQRAQALADAGRRALAAREFAAAAAQGESRGHDATDGLRLAAEQWLRIGNAREGVAALEEVFRRLGLAYPRSAWSAYASLLRPRRVAARQAPQGPEAPRRFDAAFAAGLGIQAVDLLRCAAFQRQSLALSRACDAPRRLRALAAEAVHLAARGGHARRERSRTLLARLAPEIERSDQPGLRALFALCVGASRVLSGRFREGLAELGGAHAALHRLHAGVVWESASCAIYRNRAWAYLGDLEALESTRSACETARESQDAVALVAAASGPASLAWLARDAAEEAARVSSEALARFDVQGFQSCHFSDLVSQTLVDLYRGEGVRAERRVNRAWRTFGRVTFSRIQLFRIELLFLRASAALASASERSGRARVAGAVRRLRREDLALGPALASVLEAEALRQRGRRAEADAALCHSAEACRRAELLLLADVIDAVAADRPSALARRGIARPAAFARLFLPATAASLDW